MSDAHKSKLKDDTKFVAAIAVACTASYLLGRSRGKDLGIQIVLHSLQR